MSNHIPVRMCIACRTRGEKSAFIRVGEGRGAYICRDPKCLKIATKKNSFSRALRGKVGDEIYEKLEREITGRDALDTSEGNS